MKKIYGILCIMLCLFAVGCEDDSNDSGSGAFEIINRDVAITAAGGTTIVNVSLADAKAASNQDWCTVAVSGTKVTATVAANMGLEGRTAKITLTKEGEQLSFPITQAGNKAPVPAQPTVSMNALQQSVKIFVESLMPYTASVPEAAKAWLSTKIEGDTLILTATSNANVASRNAVVTLASGELTSKITVTQTGITLVPASTTVKLDNAGDQIKVNVTSTFAFTAVSDAAWLTVTATAKDVTLKATSNAGGAARTAKVTLTSQGVTAVINVSQGPILYADYLGNWTLTALDGATPFTYNLSIAKNVDGKTYKATGWGKSVVATDSKYAITVNFDKDLGVIYILAQEKIGVYTDKGVNYDVHFYGQVELGGELYYIGGQGYICYMGKLRSDGTVQWQNGLATLNDGSQIDVIGGRYFIENAKGEILSFNIDTPFMRKPTMKKAAAASSAAGRSTANTSKTVAEKSLRMN